MVVVIAVVVMGSGPESEGPGTGLDETANRDIRWKARLACLTITRRSNESSGPSVIVATGTVDPLAPG